MRCCQSQTTVGIWIFDDQVNFYGFPRATLISSSSAREKELGSLADQISLETYPVWYKSNHIQCHSTANTISIIHERNHWFESSCVFQTTSSICLPLPSFVSRDHLSRSHLNRSHTSFVGVNSETIHPLRFWLGRTYNTSSGRRQYCYFLTFNTMSMGASNWWLYHPNPSWSYKILELSSRQAHQ